MMGFTSFNPSYALGTPITFISILSNTDMSGAYWIGRIRPSTAWSGSAFIQPIGEGRRQQVVSEASAKDDGLRYGV
jgi:hypothetical protein